MSWKNPAFTINNFFSLISKSKRTKQGLQHANINDIMLIITFFLKIHAETCIYNMKKYDLFRFFISDIDLTSV